MTEPVLFAERDPDVVEAEALAIYRATTGTDLAAADPRRLHLQALLQFIAQQRVLINFSGLQSLLQYVSDVWIDELAAFLDATRLPAQAATTMLLLTFSTDAPAIYAAGTKRASGGGFLWACDVIEKAPGAMTVDVVGTCTTAGAEPNGLSPGEIDTMVDSIPYLVSVANTTPTADGAPEETLEAFRARLRTAPDAWAVAGPREAYEALARAVSQTILDVRAVALRDNADIAGAAVAPGVVRLIVHALGGATATLLAAVEAAIDAEEVVPLTDDLVVTTPEAEGTAIDLVIAGTYYIGRDRAAEATAIQAAVALAFTAYLDWQTAKLGRDINPDELRARALAAGAKRLSLGAFAYQALKLDEVAVIPATVGPVTVLYPPLQVGDGTCVVAPAVVGGPAPPGVWGAWCKTAAVGLVPAVFTVWCVSSPGVSAEVDADAAPHSVLGLTVTLTEGGVPFVALYDRFTWDVDPGPTLTYGGIEDE